MKNESSTYLLNPNHATITFKCKHKTCFGEHLRIVGNIEELGCWDPSKSMVMTTNEDSYPNWESTQEITGPVGMEIIYKYVVYEAKTRSYYWESLPSDGNRKHIIANSGIYVLNDEEGNANSFVKRLLGPQVNEYETNFEIDNDINDIDEDLNSIKPIYEQEIYNSLSYDANQLSGNDLNEAFLFCLNQKISTDDRIIIASAHLPFEIDKTPDDNFVIRVTDESLIYSILYGMKEKEVCEVIWVGMLRNFNQFTESELNKIHELLRDNNIYMIPVSETEYKNFWIYMNKILGPIFIESTIDINNKYFFQYEEYWSVYLHINRKFGDTIYNIMQENDLIMINDVHLMLIPNCLLSKNTNARVGIYFHMAFPSSDVIKTFPYHQEILKSILLCDVIGFHVFQFARNFLTSCKRIFGIFYEIKFRGFITLNYLGRYIIIRIMHAGVDLDYIKSIIQKKEFNYHLDIYRKIINNKFCLMSIDSPDEASGLLLKMLAYKKFLDKYVECRENIILLQIVKFDNETSEIKSTFMSQVEELENEIKQSYGEGVIKLINVNKFTVQERFALFSLGSALYYLQVREGNCMVN